MKPKSPLFQSDSKVKNEARFITTPFFVSKFSANHPAVFFFVKMCVAWP
jgi:hypothetical protein